MKMEGEVKWGYPGSLEEAVSFFREGYIPHGGGTTLIRSGLGAVYGLFTVSEVSEMRGFSVEKGRVVIGAGLTYSEIVEGVSDCLLVKALSHAASNPLRNRITIGGSINVFPYWSDAVGPLVALGASLRLVDKNGKSSVVGIEEYIRNREFHREYFIVSVEFDNNGKGRNFYHREVRTHFDYPFFTVSILTYPPNGEIRIVVTGVKGRYKRLSKVESFFSGIASEFWEGEKGYGWLVEKFKENFAGLRERVENDMDAEFVSRQGVSKEYQRHVAGVVIRRGVWKILLEAVNAGENYGGGVNR